MKDRKSPLSRRRGRHSGVVARVRAIGKEPELSRYWKREIERRVRDMSDPARYMLVTEFSPVFVLYYNVSDDVFVMNAADKGTLFKRRDAAERVLKLLDRGVRIVKFTTKGAKLRRLSPFRGLGRRGSVQSNLGSKGRAARNGPVIAASLARRLPRR